MNIEEMVKNFVEGFFKEAEPDPFDPNVWEVPPGVSAEEFAQKLLVLLQQAYNKGLSDAAEIADDYADQRGVGPRIAEILREKIK